MFKRYVWLSVAAVAVAAGCDSNNHGYSTRTGTVRDDNARVAYRDDNAQVASARLEDENNAYQNNAYSPARWGPANRNPAGQMANDPERVGGNTLEEQRNMDRSRDLTARGDVDVNRDVNRQPDYNRDNAQIAGATVSGQAQQPIDDRQFVQKAASAGMMEIETGQLAKQKAGTSMVQTFAGHLIQDHRQANSDLEKIAQRKNISMPTAMMADDRAVYSRLSNLSTANFDRQFLEAQIQAHQEAIRLFDDAKNNASDPDLRSFAAQYLSALKDHLKTAQHDLNELAGKSGANSDIQR